MDRVKFLIRDKLCAGQFMPALVFLGTFGFSLNQESRLRDMVDFLSC